MNTEIDLDSLSIAELDALQARIVTAREKAVVKQRRDAIKAAKDAAAQYGFKLSELTEMKGSSPAKSKASKVVSDPKYRNLDNTDETWTGRGRQPQWFKDAVDAGVERDTMLIAA